MTAWLVICLVTVFGNAIPGGATDHVRTVALGESNSDAQRTEVLEYLGADNTDQVVTVSVNETLQTMDGIFELSGIESAYSSTALTCGAAGSGIDVMTRNIEVIPPELYALALLTAGMTDVKLAVAAPDDAPALGMTALTGVFKTWDMAPCSSFGGNPERRKLALEELALIAEIGRESEGVRQVTLVMLEAQREIVGEQVTTDEIDAIVSERARANSLDLDGGDRQEIVAFLDRLSRADIDWDGFSQGWSRQTAEDGSGVVLTADEQPEAAGDDGQAPALGRTLPSGVGGRTGPIEVSPSPTVPVDPAATATPDASSLNLPAVSTPVATPDASSLNLPAVAIPVAGDDSTTGIMGTVSEQGQDALRRWWPLALAGAVLLLVAIGARRHPSERPTTWFVSRSRVLWVGRTMRRPPI
ncbi:MAG TPA: DUF1002 domain-containing protein, partial [Thermomicrobiales bacterium]|nr:DUF1002 domain-containing protein [Thermomicrobiales bacterium]